MGCDIDHVLWSGVLLRDDPDALVAAHRAYLDSGARIIATAVGVAQSELPVAAHATTARPNRKARC